MVVLNGECSEWENVTSGVPQGSVHGPILFIIHMNDVPDSLENFCKIFADDTKIYTAVDKRIHQESLQQDLLKLSKWCKLWLLEFSIQKCKLVQYGNVKYDFEYKLEDKNGNLQALSKDTKEKDLGIWFQNTLKFDEHINYIVNRAKQTFRINQTNLQIT